MNLYLTKPQISIIVPTYNSELTLKRCIESLKSQTLSRKNYEIIVADDGSEDNTVKIAKEIHVDTIINGEHHSAANARNSGANNAKADLIAFIDSDCKAKENWAKLMVEELKTNAVVGGSLMNGSSNLISWAEYLMEFSDFSNKHDRSYVKFTPASNVAFHKNLFLRVGGFPSLKNISEDYSLGQELAKHGAKILFVPEIQVYHYGRTKRKDFLKNMERFGTRCYHDSKIIPSTYTILTKRRLFIPVIFFFKLFARLKRARRAGKLTLFVQSLHLIIIGDLAFCKGIFKEFKSK